MKKYLYYQLITTYLLLFALPGHAQLGRKARTVDLSQAESILEDARVQAAYDNYLAAWAPLDPEGATDLGLHEFDHLLTSRDEQTTRSQKEQLEHIISKLKAETHPSQLDRLGELRYKAMLAELEGIQDYAAIRDERKSNPLLYLRTRSILDLPAATYGAPIERARAALSRLEMWPYILKQARLNLSHPPKLWTEAAIRESSAAVKAVESLSAALQPTYEVAADNEPRLKYAADVAKKALIEYQVWLTTAVLPVADGKAAIGEDAYDKLLTDRHLLKISNYKVLRLAEKGMKAATKELKRAAKEIDKKKSWQELLTMSVTTSALTADQLKASYRRELEAARAHVQRQSVLTLPAEGVRVEETPADLRGRFPVWGFRAPAPLDASTEGVFYVTTPDAKAADDVKQRLLVWGHNLYAVRDAIARATYPGEHVLSARSRRAATLFQRAADAPMASLGWAQYASQLSIETGMFGSPGSRLVALKDKLAAAAEAVVDVKLHCGDLTAAEASKFLQKEAFQTPEEADAKVLWISLHPTEGMAAFMGAAELTRIRERMESRLGDQFTLREYHDRLFAYGRVPPTLIEKHMMRDWERK